MLISYLSMQAYTKVSAIIMLFMAVTNVAMVYFMIGLDIGRTQMIFGWKIQIWVNWRARKSNPSPSIYCSRIDRFGLCGLSDASGELNRYIEIPIQKNTKNNKDEEELMIKVPWSEKEILEKETNWSLLLWFFMDIWRLWMMNVRDDEG
jgi:hypothetical protein